MNDTEQRLQTLLREQMHENIDLSMQIHAARAHVEMWQIVAVIGWLMAFAVMVLI